MGRRLVAILIIVFLLLISFEAGILLGAEWNKKSKTTKTPSSEQQLISTTINRLESSGVSTYESTNMLSILGAARKPYVSRSELQHTIDGTVDKIFSEPGQLQDGYVWGLRLAPSTQGGDPYRFFIDEEGMGRTRVIDSTASSRAASLSDIKVGARIKINQLFDLKSNNNSASIELLPDSR